MFWNRLALTVLLGVVPLVAHQPVSNISVTQVIETQRVKVTWTGIDTAGKYRIKIKEGDTIVKKKIVKRARAKFKESFFSDNTTYTVYVRARANKNYSRSDWTTYTFEYYDVDHDNDLVSDDEDYDDDNDGIPDTLDEQPLDGISGTVYPIEIEENEFVDGTISIAPNDTVTWINRDDAHAVSANDGSWYSPPLQRNESYSHVFTDEGVHQYYDPTLPTVSSLSGSITVVAEWNAIYSSLAFLFI